MDLLSKLKCDLSVRENNTDFGSRLGGNPSELFFLLSKDAEMHFVPEAPISITEKDRKLIFICNEAESLLALRGELSKYYENHPDKLEMTFDRLVGLLKEDYDLKRAPNDIVMVSKCIKLADKLMGHLSDKLCLHKEILSLFDKQKDVIYQIYQDLPMFGTKGLSLKYTKEQMHNMCTPLREKISDLERWQDRILGGALSSYDKEIFISITKFPLYAQILAIGKVIRLENVIKFNLDTLMENICF